jgi:hypothetical protein
MAAGKNIQTTPGIRLAQFDSNLQFAICSLHLHLHVWHMQDAFIQHEHEHAATTTTTTTTTESKLTAKGNGQYERFRCTLLFCLLPFGKSLQLR